MEPYGRYRRYPFDVVPVPGSFFAVPIPVPSLILNVKTTVFLYRASFMNGSAGVQITLSLIFCFAKSFGARTL